MDRRGIRLAGTVAGVILAGVVGSPALIAGEIDVSENDKRIRIVTPKLEAHVRKEGYVSGVGGGTFLDKKTGFTDPGFGLNICDFLLAPGSDRAYRDKLPERMTYQYENLVHGERAKRKIEGPQICTQVERLEPKVIRGDGFVAVRWTHQFPRSVPGYESGSTWTQTLVFLPDKRYYLSSDRIRSVNAVDTLFARVDMPGHIKHEKGDTFSRIYLSYHGKIGTKPFYENFPPDQRFHYRRDSDPVPERMIRACRLQDPESGEKGPWLAGMTLQPSDVYEAWCHQRGYVSMIQEIGGRSIKAGEKFGAAYLVGYFDSIDAMKQAYDRYKGHSALEVDESGWKLTDP